MALVEDPSAPAALIGTSGPGAGGVTTANFNPPANSLIMMVITSDVTNVGNSATATVTDSLGHIFAAQAQVSASVTGYAGIFTYYLGSAQTNYNLTIVLNSAQMQGANSAGYIFQTFVITGASPIQNGNNVGSTGNGTINTLFFPSFIGSYVYGAANDFQNGIALVANGICTLKAHNEASSDAWGTFRTTNTTTSLASETVGFTNADQHAIAAYEVVPGITPATVSWFTA